MTGQNLIWVPRKFLYMSGLVLSMNQDQLNQGSPEAGAPVELLPSSSQLWILPWSDPVLDKTGHNPRSLYVEMFWLPILGPSSTWLIRRLALHLRQNPEGCSLHLDSTASQLGLKMKTSKGSTFFKVLKRCCDFGLAHSGHNDCLYVKTRIPNIPPRLLKRMDKSLIQIHTAWPQLEQELVSPKTPESKQP